MAAQFRVDERSYTAAVGVTLLLAGLLTAAAVAVAVMVAVTSAPLLTLLSLLLCFTSSAAGHWLVWRILRVARRRATTGR